MIESRADVCRWCGGMGRVADDICRPCGGRGQSVEMSAADLLDAVGNVAEQVADMRDAALRATLAFRGLLPYLPKFPVATEQRVRQALRTLEQVAHGG